MAYGFYNVYHRFASGKTMHCDHDLCSDKIVKDTQRQELQQFRGFLRNLMMHGAVGTALGGVCTIVGEPQNLLIGAEMGWHFMPFFFKVVPVSMPVLAVGLLTCLAVERFKLFGYGVEMPGNIRSHLLETANQMEKERGIRGRAKLVIQAAVGIWLIIALALHLAAVGVIGLSVIVLATALNGFIDEHQIGPALKRPCRLPPCSWSFSPLSASSTTSTSSPRSWMLFWQWKGRHRWPHTTSPTACSP